MEPGCPLGYEADLGADVGASVGANLNAVSADAELGAPIVGAEGHVAANIQLAGPELSTGTYRH